MKNYLLITGMILGSFFNTLSQTTTTFTMQHDGLTREYILYVPANYGSFTEVPLVLNLHGYTSNNSQQMAYGDFRPIADTAGFIIAHPSGTFDNSGNRWWNAFGAVGVDDVGFLSALIDTISSNYNINTDRVYSTGMSNGGFMSFELACELGSQITAIASVTGAMDVNKINSCSPETFTPAMQIHGTSDGTVPYNGNMNYASIPDVVDFWVNHNNCDATPTQTNVPDNDPSDGCTAEHYVYSNGDNGSTVEHYKIIGGGHTWPGAPIDIGVTNHDFDASVEIWRFFSQYDTPTLLSADEHLQKETLQVYPNPSEGNIKVKSNQAIKNIVVIDQIGRVVLEVKQPSGLEVEFNIDTPGVYSVRIWNIDGNSILRKVIVK